MNRERKGVLAMRVLKIAHYAITVALFAVCWTSYYVRVFAGKPVSSVSALFCVLYAVIVMLLNRLYDVYAISTSGRAELVYSLSLASLFSAGIIYTFFVISWLSFSNPLPLLLMLLAQEAVNIAWVFLASKVYFTLTKQKKTVIIYRRHDDLERFSEVGYFSQKYDVQRYIHNPTDRDQLLRDIEGFDVVFVAGLIETLRNAVVKYCIDADKEAYVAPYVGDVIMAGAKHTRNFSVPITRVTRADPPFEYSFLKRAMDIAVSSLAIALASPFMLVTALAIKLHDRGPVLYKQVRLTKDRKPFEILKFRSMRTDAEADGVARLAAEADSRITPVGRVIRAIRFDELPQLFNILRGDMSIVGPRPERPEIAEAYEKEMPAFSLRLQVKAGLTGMAQVYGRYNTLPYEKLQMDLMYINRMSVVEDLSLMFATVKILFMKKSTQGVQTDKQTIYREEG